jgi:thiosulfate/3-mercaptopyruvate sulfurtransferase
MLAALLILFHAGQPTTDLGLLIEPRDLDQMLKGKLVLALDTRSPEAYAQGHISGAIRVEVKTWQDQCRKPGGFRDDTAWAHLIGSLGIMQQTEVVVYGDQLPETARIWWLLKYLGLKDVAILNGGWKSWMKANLAIETQIAMPKTGNFQPHFQTNRLEEIEQLKTALQSGTARAKVVDARSKDEFTGKEIRGKRGGNIPGSTHLEWKELLDQDGRFLPTKALQVLFKRKGITPEDTLITC